MGEKLIVRNFQMELDNVHGFAEHLRRLRMGNFVLHRLQTRQTEISRLVTLRLLFAGSLSSQYRSSDHGHAVQR